MVCVPELVYPETVQQQLSSALLKLRVRACHALDDSDDVAALIVDERQLRSECLERQRVEQAQAAAAAASSPAFVRPYSLSTALHSLERARRLSIPFFSVGSLIAALPSILRPRPPPQPHPLIRLTSVSSSHRPFERTFPPVSSGLPSHPLLWLTAPRGACPFLPPLKGRKEKVKEGEEEEGLVDGDARRMADVENEREKERLGRHTCEMCGETFRGPLALHVDLAKHRQALQQQHWTPLLDLAHAAKLRRQRFDQEWQCQWQAEQRSAGAEPGAGPALSIPLSPASLSASGVVVVYSRHPPPAEFELSLYGDEVIWSSPPELHQRVARVDDEVWQVGVSFVHEQYKGGMHRQMLYPQPPAVDEDGEDSHGSQALDGSVGLEDVSASSFPSSEGLLLSPSPFSPVLPPSPSLPLPPLTPLAHRRPHAVSPPVAVKGVSGGAAAACALPDPAALPLSPCSPTQPYRLRSQRRSSTPLSCAPSSPSSTLPLAQRVAAKRPRGIGSHERAGGVRRQLLGDAREQQQLPMRGRAGGCGGQAMECGEAVTAGWMHPPLRSPPALPRRLLSSEEVDDRLTTAQRSSDCGDIASDDVDAVHSHGPLEAPRGAEQPLLAAASEALPASSSSLTPTAQLQANGDLPSRRSASPISSPASSPTPERSTVEDASQKHETATQHAQLDARAEGGDSDEGATASVARPSADAAVRPHQQAERARRRSGQKKGGDQLLRELTSLVEMASYLDFQERRRQVHQRQGCEGLRLQRLPPSARRSRASAPPPPPRPAPAPSSSTSAVPLPFEPLPRLTRSQRQELGLNVSTASPPHPLTA